MQTLSALECVTPAIARTKLVLFTPFRWGRTWKLAATAYLATVGTFFLPFPLIYLVFAVMAWRVGHYKAAWGITTAVIVGTVLWIVLFYLCSRIRFALFDIVLNRDEFVAPAWRKYGPQAFTWTVFKVALGSAVAIVSIAPFAASFSKFFKMMAAIPPGGQSQPQTIAAFFAFYAGFLLLYALIGLFFFVSSLLSDFIVPSLSLENATLGEAFRRLGLLIRGEAGQFCLYAVVKAGMGVALYLGTVIVCEIAILIVALVIGLIAYGIGMALHAMGVPWIALAVVGVILAVALYAFFLGYCLFMAMGTILTFLEAYMLYFLGGRYPMLGDLLERSTPAPANYSPPVYPPPVYQPPVYPPPPPIEGEP